jgi:hypothetical protein
LSLVAVGAHIALAAALVAIAGLDGLAAALAATTAALLISLLTKLDATIPTLRRLGVATGTIAAIAVTAFLLPSLLLEPVAAAAVGVVAYAVLIVGLRPPGLIGAWRYLRTLA